MMASDMRRCRLASKKVVSNDTDGHAIKPSLKNILNCYHIHRNGISHRDIKPENIMLSGYWKACLAKIKLICFSICTCKKNANQLVKIAELRSENHLREKPNRSHSYDRSNKNSLCVNIRERDSSVFSVQSSRRLKSDKLTLLK